MTFTPEDGTLDDEYLPCRGAAIEIDWDEAEEAFIGEIHGHDVRYYFESDYGTESCYFKLRSVSLGYPAGYEQQWLIGSSDTYEGTTCRYLETTVGTPDDPETACSSGTISTICASKIKPTTCTGCACACECLCVTYTRGTELATARICWDGQGQWTGTIEINEYESKDITIAMFPANLLCDAEYDPYCDETDTSCRLVVSLANSPSQEYQVPSCPDLSHEFTFECGYGEDDETISIRCAICDEDCEPGVTPCCNGYPIPPVIYCTMDIYVEVVDNFAGGAVVVPNYLCTTIVFNAAREPEPSQYWRSGPVAMPPCLVPSYSWTEVPFRGIEIGCAAVPGSATSAFLAAFILFDENGNQISSEWCQDSLGGEEERILVVTNCDPFFARKSCRFGSTFCCETDYLTAGGPGQYQLLMTFDMVFTA